jgi:hypothetical protein
MMLHVLTWIPPLLSPVHSPGILCVHNDLKFAIPPLPQLSLVHSLLSR